MNDAIGLELRRCDASTKLVRGQTIAYMSDDASINFSKVYVVDNRTSNNYENTSPILVVDEELKTHPIESLFRLYTVIDVKGL